jgi:hypothetical protein
MIKDLKQIEDTKRLMGALVRMKPKPHEDMKIGNRPTKRSKATQKREKKK